MTSDVHLLVLVHGMWGNPGHLAAMADMIREAYTNHADSTDFHLLIAETNVDNYTYDGVDHGGERVAEEVIEEIKKLRQDDRIVTQFSITGYSLGGLVSRYVIGILHQQKFFQDVTPVNFNTFATPHIGLPRYPNFFSALTNSLGPSFLSRTGEQLFVLDKWASTNRSLLSVMADPDRVFYKALQLFPHTTIYANAVNDPTVPYVTAAIEMEDPFLDRLINGLEIILQDEYPNLIISYQFPAEGSVRAPSAVKPTPPFLPVKFPYNMMIYLSLPILLPTALSIVMVRMSLAAHSSRHRVKLLEKDESYNSKLAHIVSALENEMEDHVVNIADEQSSSAETIPAAISAVAQAEASENKWWKPCSLTLGEHPKFCSCKRKRKQKVISAEDDDSDSPITQASTALSEKSDHKECKWHSWRRKREESQGCLSSPHHKSSSSPHESADEVATDSITAQSSATGSSCPRCKKKKSTSAKPILTEKQREMVVFLNALANLKKERAFFDEVRNAHGSIICRVDGLSRGGEGGIIKHWADRFVF